MTSETGKQHFVPLVFGAPDANPFLEIVQQCEKLAHEQGWDGPTMLFWVGLDKEFMDDAGMTAKGMTAFQITEGPMPDGAGEWHPADLLKAMLIAAMTEPLTMKKRLDEFSWVGFVLVFETWSVRVPEDQDELKQLDADREARRLHERADKTQMRIAHGNFGQYGEFAVLRRDGHESEPVPDDAVPCGRVVEALKKLTLAARILRTVPDANKL